MIHYKLIYLTMMFLFLGLFQLNFIKAEESLDIPADIINDWDEVVIEQDRQISQEIVPLKEPQRVSKKYQKKNSAAIKKTKTLKQFKKKKTKPLKSYKSPLHKPILYQKIYIRDKRK